MKCLDCGKRIPDGESCDCYAGSLFTGFKNSTEERNFCPRCGKRLPTGFVEISIHTCTPPKEKS